MDAEMFGLFAVLIALTLWHETGHWIAARAVRIPVRCVSVGMGPVVWRRPLRHDTDLVLRALPLGMSIAVPGRRESGGALRRPIGHDLLIAAGGPLASFALTALLIAAAWWLPLPEAWRATVGGVGVLSALLALFNLLPVPGLDGGHLFLLTAARLGWVLSPAQEARLHRWGVNLVAFACLAPLCLIVWRHLTAIA
jgi:membrane-associated protease RseP (regulator of RpoE activity)